MLTLITIPNMAKTNRYFNQLYTSTSMMNLRGSKWILLTMELSAKSISELIGVSLTEYKRARFDLVARRKWIIAAATPKWCQIMKNQQQHSKRCQTITELQQLQRDVNWSLRSSKSCINEDMNTTTICDNKDMQYQPISYAITFSYQIRWQLITVFVTDNKIFYLSQTSHSIIVLLFYS